MANLEWLRQAQHGLQIADIYSGVMSELIRNQALAFLVLCNYGEGRSTGVVQDLVNLGIENIAYVAGGLTAISHEPNPNYLIALINQAPYRMVILTRPEIRDHNRIINMLAASVHSDMASAYQYIQNRG